MCVLPKGDYTILLTSLDSYGHCSVLMLLVPYYQGMLILPSVLIPHNFECDLGIFSLLVKTILSKKASHYSGLCVGIFPRKEMYVTT
jgi:hypothetical protein